MEDDHYYMQIELPPEHVANFADMALEVVMNNPNIIMQTDQLFEYQPSYKEAAH